MIDYEAKPCVECGAEFIPHSPMSKYCPACVPKVYRRKHAERVRRWRERMKENERQWQTETTS